MRCRICRTAKNLKYTSQQIRLQSNKNKNKLRLPLSALPQTSGNICIQCDERLQNFHQLDDDSDAVDVDSDGFHGNKMPIIGNDDQKLFNMFYNKTELHSKQSVQTQSIQSKSHSHTLGSDGDTEIIEVLTSREATPDLMANYNGNGFSHSTAIATSPKVIDIIDLEDYDETGKEQSGRSENFSITESSVKKETHLLGCLNLVSSDSESEINFMPCPLKEESPKIQELPTTMKLMTNITTNIMNGSVDCSNNNNNLKYEDCGVTIKHNLPVCSVCGVSCIDKQSLHDHIRCEHEVLKCLVCNEHFQVALDLVNHMRQKHRSYDGHELCEGARCSQDSAMTIRLRFMQRLTFYECQLCGLIDSQFKAHKGHIMQQHADESKSLKDPMMKTQLKCPSCHQNCGTQPIDICRHLLSKHEPAEQNKHLNEINDTRILGLSKKLIQSLQQGTRFFTLGTFKQNFFECLLCQKVFSNNRSIAQHLNGHNIDDWKRYKAEKSGASNTSGTVELKRQLKRKIETRNNSKLEFQHSDAAKKWEQPPIKKPKLEYQNPLKNAVKTKKNTLPKYSKSKSVEMVAKKLSSLAVIPLHNTNTNSITPSNIKRQKKLKHKLDKNSQNKRGQSKTVTKVKVKPPLRHFPTQKYNCKHCQLSFKGFRKLQLHLLSSHRSEEYYSCESCTSSFISKSSLEQHRSKNICRHKRKCTTTSQCGEGMKYTNNDNLDENFNKDDGKSCTYKLKSVVTESLENHSETNSEPMWLKELIELSHQKKFKNINNLSTAIKDNVEESSLKVQHEQFNTVVQTFCSFCGKLFANIEAFSEHEKNHIAQKDMPWIHFSQRNSELSST